MEDGESRSIGSSNILAWKKRGMVGLVTSGGLADTDEIIYHKVPDVVPPAGARHPAGTQRAGVGQPAGHDRRGSRSSG